MVPLRRAPRAAERGSAALPVIQSAAMRSRITRSLACLATALVTALGACEFSDEVLFQSFAGESPSAPSPVAVAQRSGELGAAPPEMDRTVFRPAPMTAGATPATAQGRETARLRVKLLDLRTSVGDHDDELQHLRRSLALQVGAYMKALAPYAVGDKNGATKAGSQFAARMREARSRLGRINGVILKMNGLAAKITVDASNSAQLLHETRDVIAAVDRTNAARKPLEVLEKETNRTVQLIHRMLSALHLDIGRHANYTGTQAASLEAFADRVDPDGPGARAARAMVAEVAVPAALGPRRPLVTIRFNRPDVAYERQLYEAVRAALARRPDVAFDVVGIAPQTLGEAATPTAMRRAGQVRRSLEEMGLPADRINVSALTSVGAQSDEVRIYVRADGAAPRAPPARQATAKAAPAEAAPSRRPATAEPPPSPADEPPGHYVQVGSFREHAAAEASWARLETGHGALLGGASHYVKTVELGGKGTFHRVLIGPYPSRRAASRLCTSLKARKISCFLVRSAGAAKARRG